MSTRRVNVVIPSYNDFLCLPSILSALNHPSVDRVILVDDYSSPPLSSSLARYHPNLTLIRHTRNLGKSKALLTGINKLGPSKNHLLILDSDLVGLSSDHISLLTSPVVRSNYKMVIGEVSSLYPLFRYTGYSIAYSGLRCFNYELIPTLASQLTQIGYINGFLAEANINTAFFKKVSIAKVRLSGLSQTYKISKFGLKGLFNDWQIMLKIAKHLGLIQHLSQLAYGLKLPQLYSK